MSQENDLDDEPIYTCKLYDKEQLVGEIYIDQELEEYKLVDGAYYISSDEPKMPTDAMMEFMRMGKLRVPLPKPIDPIHNQTKKMLDDYKDRVLAESALDDMKDIVVISKNLEKEQMKELIMDLFYSKIIKHKETLIELNEYLEKVEDG